MSYSIISKKLFKGTVTATAGGGSATTLYTNPSGTKTIITQIVLSSTNAAAQRVTVSLVDASGGSAGTEAAADRLISNLSIPAYDVIIKDVKWVLEDANDTIQAFQETASAINIGIYGVVQK